MIPFQCNMFHISNVDNQEPIPKEDKLMMFIRRGELGEIWDHDPSTVSGNLRDIKNIQCNEEWEVYLIYPFRVTF